MQIHTPADQQSKSHLSVDCRPTPGKTCPHPTPAGRMNAVVADRPSPKSKERPVAAGLFLFQLGFPLEISPEGAVLRRIS